MQTPDYSQIDYSQVVGVFRDPSQADHAVEELKHVGFGQIQVAEYDPGSPSEMDDLTLHHSDRRVLVQVRAVQREHEAVNILAQHGANNADLPPGVALLHGSFVRSDMSEGH
jgi:hypothetical protein